MSQSLPEFVNASKDALEKKLEEEWSMVMLKLVSVSIIKHCISVAGMQTKFLPQKTYSRQIYWQGKIQFNKKNLLSLNLWPQQVDTICVQSPKLQASQNNTKNAKYKIQN